MRPPGSATYDCQFAPNEDNSNEDLDYSWNPATKEFVQWQKNLSEVLGQQVGSASSKSSGDLNFDELSLPI